MNRKLYNTAIVEKLLDGIEVKLDTEYKSFMSTAQDSFEKIINLTSE